MKDQSKPFNIEEAKKDPDLCFAALKLIQQLYHDGYISSRLFHSILNDCADVVDLTKFIDY